MGACQGKHTGTRLSGFSHIVPNMLRFSFHFLFPASIYTTSKQSLFCTEGQNKPMNFLIAVL